MKVAEIAALAGAGRRQAILDAMHRQQRARRLLAPAEAVNALTVGAVHDDASRAKPTGYAVDPSDGLPSVSPITPSGSGYRRSVKPDLVANGGRVVFNATAGGGSSVLFRPNSGSQIGIRVAAPSQGGETHVSGTSPAAAIVAGQAARLYELVEQVTNDSIPLSRRHRASAVKALMIHGTSVNSDLAHSPLTPESVLGNGAAVRDYSNGCADNEAVVLFFGSIGALEEVDLRFPLPDGLNDRDMKRIDATLAWLTPVNWRHRQYRRAALSFVAPAGAIPDLGKPVGLPTGVTSRGANTVDHRSWQVEKAFGAGQGSDMTIRVKCHEQAGGLAGERVDFAVALSLWVAPNLTVDVYSQVRDQVAARIPVRPRV